MVYEITNKNKEKLYNYLKKEIEIENKKTYVYEDNEQILGYIQFERSHTFGHITHFDYLKGFNYVGKELLLKAMTYFYIFHLEPVYLNEIEPKKTHKLLKEFKINIFKRA